MVLGHTPVPYLHFLAIFRMPLFLFVAGYCFKEKYLDDLKTFSKRRFKGLYVPFIKWNLIFLLLHNLFISLCIIGGEEYSCIDYVYRIGELAVMRRSEILLGGYWFLSALLFGSMIGWFVIKFCKGRMRLMSLMLVMLMLLSIGGNFLVHAATGALYPPSMLLYAFFFVSGHYIAKFNARIKEWFQSLSVVSIFRHLYRYKFVAVLLMGVFTFAIASILDYFAGVSITRRMTWDMPLFIMGALSGIFMVLCVCKFFIRGLLRKILAYYGNNTMSILTWHFLSFKLVSFLLICFYGLSITELADTPCLYSKGASFWLVYFVVGITVPLLITSLISKINRLIRSLFHFHHRESA